MIAIEYDNYSFKRKTDQSKELIFDEFRRTWLRLTPEEWVRQNFVRYLVYTKKYPSALVAMEKKIMLGELSKRFDVLVYSRDHQPWMMIECKAMGIDLTESVLSQVLRYNVAVPVRYLVVTNGTTCMAFRKQGTQLEPVHELPEFGE